MLEIIRIENNPVKSNCFIVFDKQESNNCLVIDPGSENDNEIVSAIQNNQLTIDYIFLTHEHFDHVWSVNAVLEKFSQARLVCSKICGEKIIDRKKNCSLFYNQIGFELPQPSLITDELINGMHWGSYAITFIDTPGHGSGNVCIIIGENLFTGDTLIQNNKTVTKLPGGSLEELKQTIEKFQLLKGRNLKIYPGHGDSFLLDDYDLSKML
jgi:glyoxylase-like metal-dependent hydrolase (beta-lactamase superfamily II)